MSTGQQDSLRLSRCLSQWDGTRDGTRDVLYQSQSQSQSQSQIPFLSLTAVDQRPPTQRKAQEARISLWKSAMTTRSRA